MARARNIKPAFFDNDELAENDPLGRLLFIGLWTLCDFNGNLEWREKRIKKQLLAYDSCDIKKLAINLDKSGFVRFYSDGEKMYLNIENFAKHQNPHKNERAKGSDIPNYSESMRQAVDLKELAINHDKSRLEPEDYDSNPADSLIPYPDSLNLIPEDKDSLSDNSDAVTVLTYFNEVCSSRYKHSTKSHIENINARLGEGHSIEDCKSVIDFKFKEWGNDSKMAGYLRPQTIFSTGKFQGYLMAAKTQGGKVGNGINAIGTDFSAPEGWN